MTRARWTTIVALGLLSAVLTGGCPDITITLPDGTDIDLGGSTVTVVIYNDTDFYIDPGIVFDDDAGFWASLVPSESLATGELLPGEELTYSFDCDELGLIRSANANQYDALGWIGQADTSRTLEREDEYDCGDTILFHFIGTGDSFGVVTAVNNRVVD